MQVRVQDLDIISILDEQRQGGPSEVSAIPQSNLEATQSAHDQAISTSGFVCRSCNFIAEEGAEPSVCGLFVLGCIQLLFALDREVKWLAPTLQEQRIRQFLSEEDFFEDLMAMTEILRGHCRWPLAEILEAPIFSESLVLSSRQDINDEQPVEAQMLYPYSGNPFLFDEDPIAIIFSAHRNHQSQPRDHYAASFRFQSPLSHRFALIDCIALDSGQQVQVHLLDSPAALCNRIASIIRQRDLVASGVYTLGAGSSCLPYFDDETLKRSSSFFAGRHDTPENKRFSQSTLHPYPHVGHATYAPALKGSVQSRDSDKSDTHELCSPSNLGLDDLHVLKESNIDLSGSSEPPFSFSGAREDDMDKQMPPSNSELHETQVLHEPGQVPLPPTQSTLKAPKAEARMDLKMSSLHQDSTNVHVALSPSSSLNQHTIWHSEPEDEDDLQGLGSTSLKSSPAYELMSASHLIVKTNERPILNTSIGCDEHNAEPSIPIPIPPNEYQNLPRREASRPKSSSHRASSSPRAASSSRAKAARKVGAGDFSWMMSLQEASGSKYVAKRATISQRIEKQETLRPSVPSLKERPASQAASSKAAPVLIDHGQLELLFRAQSSRRPRKEQEPEQPLANSVAMTHGTPSLRPQSGKWSGTPSQEPSLTNGPASAEESMSGKGKLQQRQSQASLHERTDFQWQIALQASASRARASKSLSRRESSRISRNGDVWSPLFLRPELLQAEAEISDRDEGSSGPLPKKPRSHVRNPVPQPTQSYNKSRNDIAWQMALVSKRLVPSEDYLKEREERFIQLNPRYKPEKFECLICFETIQGADGSRVMNCEHSFCRTCLTGHVRSQLEENLYPILCPVCFPDHERISRGFVDDVVMMELDVSERELEKFAELQMAAIIVKIDCPGCKGNLVIDREDYLSEPFITCTLPGCSSRFCRACLLVMDGHDDRHTCKIDQELDALMKANGWRYCPGCRTPILKESGCNHMTCKTPGCTTHFCYVCGDSVWDAQSPQSLSTRLSTHYRKCNQFDVDPPVPPRPGVVLDAQGRPRRDCAIQ